ncbi:hypothetical protein, no similarity [Maudiozyma saulgeensis]|uniref:Kinesin motor domain-containing protein n=1 Tax=Maudiozyma saulgeensis TaxID=1789683 RepID=A0A1X7RAG2_9SACH|nr:hypothetical protein, no similarity [Kazachstania saulgeensis]
MNQARLFLRLDQESNETAAIANDTITFKSVQDEDSQVFRFDKLFQENDFSEEIQQLLIEPITKDAVDGISSTVVLCGNKNMLLANDTIFQYLIPKLDLFLKKRINDDLIDITFLDGATNLPIENLNDIDTNQTNSSNSKIITIHIRHINSNDDKIVSSYMNIFFLQNFEMLTKFEQSKDNSSLGKLVRQILSDKTNDLYIFLHCMITPVNQSEILNIFQKIVSFKENWSNSNLCDINILNQSQKEQNLINNYTILDKTYLKQINLLNDEIQNYKLIDNLKQHSDEDNDKLTMKLKILDESNGKLRDQIKDLRQLLSNENENSDILNAYMDKSIIHNNLLNNLSTVEQENNFFNKIDTIEQQYSNILKENNKSLKQLLQSQAEQEFTLQQESVDLKMNLQDIVQSNKTLETKLQPQSLFNTTTLMSPSSIMSSTHSYKTSISSSTSSLGSNITSDTESTTTHSKASHLPLSLNSGFQLKVLRPK